MKKRKQQSIRNLHKVKGFTNMLKLIVILISKNIEVTKLRFIVCNIRFVKTYNYICSLNFFFSCVFVSLGYNPK